MIEELEGLGGDDERIRGGFGEFPGVRVQIETVVYVLEEGIGKGDRG